MLFSASLSSGRVVLSPTQKASPEMPRGVVLSPCGPLGCQRDTGGPEPCLDRPRMEQLWGVLANEQFQTLRQASLTRKDPTAYVQAASSISACRPGPCWGPVSSSAPWGASTCLSGEPARGTHGCPFAL